MRMNKQTRAFAKQVHVDLLTLSDIDLFQTVHLWVNGQSSGPVYNVSKEAQSALGYTLRVGEPYVLSFDILSGNELEAGIQWLAPAPLQLRELLMEMKLEVFIEHVLPLAFQSLHVMHPEWGEGATFNAHLANHLRSIGMRQREMTRELGTSQSCFPKERQ
jgi:hypothetical protein